MSENALPQFAKRIAQVATSFASVAAVEQILRKSIAAALDAEKATAGLAAALKAQGAAAVSALPGLKAHAEALSRISIADDEAIQGAQKVLVSLGGLLGPQLDRATKAALDLAAGLGIDLTEAATMIAKAAQGSVVAFTRLGFEFQKNATDAQKLDTVLAGVQRRFGGMSEAEIATVSGQLHELSEAFGELLETLGTKLIGGTTNVGAFTKILHALNDEATKPGTIGLAKSLAAIGLAVGTGDLKALGLVLAGIFTDVDKAAKSAERFERFPDALARGLDGMRAAAKQAADLAKQEEEATRQAEALAAAIARINATTATQVFAPQQREPKASIATGSVPGTIKGLAESAANVAGVSAAELDKQTAAVEAQAQAWAEMEVIIQRAIDFEVKYGDNLETTTAKWEEFALSMEETMTGAIANAAGQLGATLVDAAFGAEVAWSEALRNILRQLVQVVVQALIVKAITTAIGGAGGGAAMSGGGVVGETFARGGIVSEYAASGFFRPRGTDTVPAMLTPGEMVLTRGQTQSILGGRATLSGPGGGGGSRTFNVYALDSKSFSDALKRNSASLVEAFEYLDARSA